MKVALVLDGESREVEIDLAAGSARIGERSFPVRVLSATSAQVELEIDGEKVVVEGWPSGTPSPEGPVVLNGERYQVQATTTGAARAAPATAPVPLTSAPSPPAAAGGAIPIVPPMPGRVVELRVAEGDPVEKGQVLLVLEAMKMRNEIQSPASGRVAGLAVSVGSNARARETMLRIEPA